MFVPLSLNSFTSWADEYEKWAAILCKVIRSTMKTHLDDLLQLKL